MSRRLGHGAKRSREQGWRDLVEGRTSGPGAALARAGLSALSLPYRLGLEANLALYQWGLKARTQPALPVVSVGNLSLGGTGKSTAVAYLARQLQARGVTAAIVARGYGRRAPGSVQLVSTGEGLLLEPALAGDEPTMLAQMLPGVPVAVGKRRERVIALLARATPAQVVLLDDGFQYFRMERLVDLVLVDAGRDCARERLFPAGYLREPWAHLRRAHQVWFTHADRVEPETLAAREQFVRRYYEGPVVLTRHRLTALRGPQGQRCPPEQLAGERVLAVSALGNPASFEDSLIQAGAEVTALRYPDHHQYTRKDGQRMLREKGRRGAELVVVTEKDAVKLESFTKGVWVAECELSILRGEEEVEAMLAHVASRAEEQRRSEMVGARRQTEPGSGPAGDTAPGRD